MKLDSLTIRYSAPYDKTPGYVGEVTFDGPLGRVQIRTGDALSRHILNVCASELITAAQQVAGEMTASIVEQAAPPAIEAAPETQDSPTDDDDDDIPL